MVLRAWPRHPAAPRPATSVQSSALRRQSLVDLREDDEAPVTPRGAGRRRPQRTASVAAPGGSSPFWSTPHRDKDKEHGAQAAHTNASSNAGSGSPSTPSRLMKGRHQFKRRFSLQPSFLKDDHHGLDDSPRHAHR